MQASMDAADKGAPWANYPSVNGSINRITGAFVVTFPTPGTNPRRGYKYSGICKQAQPLF